MAAKSDVLVGFEEVADTGRNSAATLQKTGIITVPAKLIGDRSYKLLYNRQTQQVALQPHAGNSVIHTAGSLRYINVRHILKVANVALPDRAMRLTTNVMSDGTIIINLLS